MHFLRCQHAIDISLVLILKMGLVSSQFHIKLDSNFQTLRELGAKMLPSWWQIKCGFVQQPTKASQQGLAPPTKRTNRALPMPQPEGDQPTNTNGQQQSQRPRSNKTQSQSKSSLLYYEGQGTYADQSID